MSKDSELKNKALQEDKKKATRSFVLSIILAVLGVVVMVLTANSARFVLTGFTAFEELGVEDIKDQLVSVEVYENYGSYLEDEDGAAYYIIYTGNPSDSASEYKLMGIKVPSSSTSKMSEMTDYTFSGYSSAVMEFNGQIKKMSDEQFTTFKTYMQTNLTDDTDYIESKALNYYIDTTASMPSDNSVYVLFFVVGAILTIWGIVWLIVLRTNKEK